MAATDEPLKDLEQIAEKLQAIDRLGRAEAAPELASAFAGSDAAGTSGGVATSWALAITDWMAGACATFEALIDILGRGPRRIRTSSTKLWTWRAGAHRCMRG